MRAHSGNAQTVAEFLQRRLARDHPQRITGLHATASHWFAEHNMLREAVVHALAAGEEDRAVELIEVPHYHYAAVFEPPPA